MGPCKFCMGAMSHCYRNYGKAFFFLVFFGVPMGIGKEMLKNEVGPDRVWKAMGMMALPKRYGCLGGVALLLKKRCRS